MLDKSGIVPEDWMQEVMISVRRGLASTSVQSSFSDTLGQQGKDVLLLCCVSSTKS